MLFISSNNMKATHMDNFSPKISSGLSRTVPCQAVDCLRTVPSSIVRSHFFRTGMHGHFRAHDYQNHFHAFLYKNKSSRRKPLPFGVSQTPEFKLDAKLLLRGSTFPLAPTKTDSLIAKKSGENVELLSLFLLLPLLSFFSLSHPTDLVQDGSGGMSSLSHVTTPLVLLDFSLIHFSIVLDFYPIMW